RRPRRGLFRGRDRRDPRALGALSDPRVSVEVEPLSTEQTLAVETRDLACTYMSGATSVAALDGVTLTVRRGEFVAVMGPSGSGKSTLLNVIAGLERPTSGWVRVDGEDLAALDEAGLAGHRSKRVGMVFQAFNLLPRYRVVDNVALPLIFAGVPRAERTARARALLDRLGMSSRDAARRPRRDVAWQLRALAPSLRPYDRRCSDRHGTRRAPHRARDRRGEQRAPIDLLDRRPAFGDRAAVPAWRERSFGRAA